MPPFLMLRAIRFRCVSMLPVCLICISCGPAGPKREFADVSGVVTYKGEPLTTGVIVFQPANGIPITSEISSEGAYQLKGVVGPNTVMINCREPLPDIDPQNPPDEPPRVPQSLIPEQYSTVMTPLKFDVETGSNVADFDLEDLPDPLQQAK